MLKIKYPFTLALAATLLMGFMSANLARAQSTDGAADSSTEEQSCDPDGSCVTQRTRVFVVSTAPIATSDADSDGVAGIGSKWNFGLASQVLAVSHKGASMSYGLLGLYGVRTTRSTLVILQGGVGKDSEGNLAVGAALMAGYKAGERAAVGIALTGTDSIDQRGDKDREVLKLRSVGVGPSVTMTLGSAINVTIAGGVAWSGKPIDGRRIDGVLVEEPGRSYAFGAFGTVSVTVGLRGLAK